MSGLAPRVYCIERRVPTAQQNALTKQGRSQAREEPRFETHKNQQEQVKRIPTNHMRRA